MRKMMMSPAVFFFIFSKFLFFGFLGRKGKGAKNYQFQFVTLEVSKTVDHIKIFGTQL